MIHSFLAALISRAKAVWEAFGHCSDDDTFIGHGLVLYKEKIWDENDRLDNVAYLFEVFDEDHQERLTFQASPAFPDAVAAKVGDRIRYEYLLWGCILPIDLKLANNTGKPAPAPVI